MGIQRHFLGWDGPMLPAAARWLATRFGGDRQWDLSGVTVVVPGRRAARRLLELLVQEAGDRTLFPPELLTLGTLPEWLCETQEPIASPLQSALARAGALRSLSRQTLAALTTEPPGDDDLIGWWELAEPLESLGSELAAAGLRIADVPDQAAEAAFDLHHLDRFAALAEIDRAYQANLAAAGLVDRQEARLRAVEANRCRSDGQIVLVAAADLPPLTARLLRIAGESLPVTALVHAPDEHADGFDALGAMHAGYWSRQRVALRDEWLRFVDRPTDQAREVVRILAQRTGADQPGVAADQVTVGLGDEAMAGPVLRTLSMADVPARFGPGRPVLKSRPATLLEALGAFAASRRLNDFAELLRHPDIEAHVTRCCPPGATRAWLTLLDGYATEYLQGRLDGDWLGPAAQQAALKAMWDAAAALLPADPRETRPLHAWSEPILAALRQVYGHQTLSRHDADHHALGESLGAIADALREQARLDDEALAAPPITVAQAIAVTLRRLESARLAEADGRPAVELVGFLELPLDDAPHLIVASMNEGAVPGASHVDPLLPDSLRGRLGLADDARRYARDLMMLSAIVHSRPNVTLIAGRRSAEGEPLAPSRLLLACDDETLVRRVDDFYRASEKAETDSGGASAPVLLTPGGRDRFLIPPPLMDEPVLDRLSVTAFRDYLACRYRFYLKHVCRLEGIDDAAVEMDAMVFGSLAHDVLQAFGESDRAESTDADGITAFLSDALDQCATDRFGADRRPAVRVQVEQLRERLGAFAPHQAAMARDGWRIVRGRVEKRLEAAIDLDGSPFTLVGRVDRLDHHPQRGYRILDYKTGSAGVRPDKSHRRRINGTPTWTDLQLPLYRDLCEPLGVTGQVEVGYINLPKKLPDTGLALADWSAEDFDSAIQERNRIIRAVRGQHFWPPQDPPTHADDFTGLCADLSLNRPDLIAASRDEGGEAT